jgi:hypothetical protein
MAEVVNIREEVKKEQKVFDVGMKQSSVRWRRLCLGLTQYTA